MIVRDCVSDRDGLCGPSAMVIAKKNIQHRATSGGGILVDMQSGACFELNRVATEIWSLLAAGESEEAMAQTVAQRYNLAQNVAHADVKRICQEFASRGLAYLAEAEG